MQSALLELGHSVGEHRIARLMKSAALTAHARCRFRARAGSGTSALAMAALQDCGQHLQPQRANQVWVTDMTYLKTQQGWIFLAAVMDAYTRQIVGWAMDSQMHSTLIEHALLRALRQRRPAAGWRVILTITLAWKASSTLSRSSPFIVTSSCLQRIFVL